MTARGPGTVRRRSLVLIAGLLSLPLTARAQPTGAAPRFGTVWSRSCPELSAPIASPGATTVHGCSARFDLSLGRYQGRTPWALRAVIDDRRGIVDEGGPAGIALVPLGGSSVDPRPLVRARSGHIEAIAVSADRTRVAAVEAATSSRAAVVVRDASRLRVQARADLPGATGEMLDGIAIAFAPDGAVLAAVPCRGPCALSGVVRLEGDRLVAVAGLGGPTERATFAPGGRFVALVRPGGTVDVLATDGSSAPRRAPARLAVERLALSADGTILALASEERLRVSRLSDGAATPLIDVAKRASDVVFAPEGHRLLVGGDRIEMMTEGVAAHPAPQLPEGIEPAPGFARGEVRDGILRFATSPGAEYAADQDLVAAWAGHDGDAMVRISIGDADEFVTFEDPDRWGRAVAERYEPYSPLVSPADRREHRFRVSRDARGQRSMEMMVHGDGCDPSDRWVRIAERGESLVRATLEVPSGVVRPERIEQWRRAFLSF